MQDQNAVAKVTEDKKSAITGNWCTSYLHTNRELHKRMPELLQRIRDTIFEVDDQNWGILRHRNKQNLHFRCIEHHDYGAGGMLEAGCHYDTGSLVTVDIMLTQSGEDYEGGELYTPVFPATQPPQAHVFDKGDMVLFLSHKYHQVRPITQGRRTVMVLELWEGPERTCGHRCLQPVGECEHVFQNQKSRRAPNNINHHGHYF